MLKIKFLKKKLLKNFPKKIQRGTPCWFLKNKNLHDSGVDSDDSDSGVDHLENGQHWFSPRYFERDFLEYCSF